LRFLLYFNPIFVVFSFAYLIYVILSFKKHNISDYGLLTVVLFLFGLTHVVLYPEGSFGHPYWIYYFIPFMTFSTAFIFLRMLESRNKLPAFLLFGLSFLFLFKIEGWKTKQINSNLWRYELATKVNKYLKPHEEVMINVDSAIDPDMLEYQFFHPVVVKQKRENIDGINYYIYSCAGSCNLDDKTLVSLEKYRYIKVESRGAEAYIFNIKEKSNSNDLQGSLQKTKRVNIKQQNHNGNAKNLYEFMKDLLQVPQL
ncbi:MAG: hypothetical protein M1326_07215, partial [Cyanobacteria bacterium]|nr:hypothetical protein [Cyanobacteriota bacterium]